MATDSPASVHNRTSPLPSTTPPKPKNLFNLSAWLYIGSAFSASGGMGVIFLKLAGKTSFTKPFGVCFASSLVMGILGEMYKDRTIDMTPVFEAMKSYIPNASLGESSSFTFENQTYYIAPTEGDGACGAHALLGTKENGYTKYQFRSGNVRDHYISKLLERKRDPNIERRWKEWMVHFVKDYLLPDPGFYSSMVFKEPLVQELKDGLARLETELKDLKFAQGQLFDQALQDEECYRLIAEELQNNKESINDLELHVKMRNFLDGIITRITHKDIGRWISANLISQQQIEVRRDQCFNDFVEKDKVIQAYIEGISTSAYYFSTQEIGLMAHLFDQYVIVFHEENGVLTKELDEGKSTDPTVVIFHKGIHFSRCESQNSL